MLSLILFVPLAGLGFYSAEWPIYLQLLPLFLLPFFIWDTTRWCGSFAIMGMLRKDSWPKRITALALYTLIALAYFIFFGISQTFLAAVLFFLGLTVFHWGQSDHALSVRVHKATYLYRSKVLIL